MAILSIVLLTFLFKEGTVSPSGALGYAIYTKY